ncbi:MAG: MerR family DNA-binding transcriptional regulator [Rhodoferax sp.]|nr:MerR family DNA-binding transcriptional regulator [Actinomycetota bacterium]
MVVLLDVYVNVKHPATVPARTWTIAEVADEFGITHRTVRYYEDKGLVTPERRGTLRVFHPRDRTRLRLVLRGKRLGFPLDEIRTIVDMYDQQPGESGQLSYLLDQIDERRGDLWLRRRDIDAALAELDDLERRCRTDLARLAAEPEEH